MSLRRKDEKEKYEMLEEPKSHMFGGGTQAVYWFCLNIWKLEVTRDFFPVRFVKTYCKKNYFLLQ